MTYRETDPDGPLDLRGQFFWGCVGAATPWVLRGAQVVGYKLDVTFPAIGAGSVLIFLAVLLFGGAVAIILHSHNRWVAWYHGATYQIVVAAIVHHGAVSVSHPP